MRTAIAAAFLLCLFACASAADAVTFSAPERKRTGKASGDVEFSLSVKCSNATTMRQQASCRVVAKDKAGDEVGAWTLTDTVEPGAGVITSTQTLPGRDYARIVTMAIAR